MTLGAYDERLFAGQLCHLDMREWKKLGRFVWQSPYAFSIEQTRLPKGRVRLRVSAADIWESHAASGFFTVEVSSVAAQMK